MRVKRVNKFKRQRHRKTGRIVLFAFVLPSTILLMGYLISSIVILPAMK